MSSRIFLQSLQHKLKGGNSRAIHLNALPGRFATRLDIKELEAVRLDLPDEFLHTLLTKSNFEFRISFGDIDLNLLDKDEQKQLGILSKRLNSIVIENEDYYKEHGMKTLGFGYPILIRRSTKDPSKVIKAPLFIWPLEAIKSKTKVNEWSLLRNKALQENGRLTDADLHSVGINEVLLSFIKGEDGIDLPNLTEGSLEDALIDSSELLQACANVLNALNPGSRNTNLETLTNHFINPVNALPEASRIDQIAGSGAYIHFGGVFGLFRAQKESIITDITKLLDRFDEFQFDEVVAENLSTTPFSAVETDPSQQAIISALGSAPNQIIQGPPGTGKSQSLTALITNALANNLKCLVVCEKKTALDVIRQNLTRRNEKLGALVAVIDDVTDDRDAIVDSVRERQQENPFSMSFAQAEMQYESAMRAIAESVDAVNAQHLAMEKPIYRGRSWTWLVGRYLQLRREAQTDARREAQTDVRREDQTDVRLDDQTGVPLKNILNTADFKFQQDEVELDELMIALDKGEAFYKQSLHLHPAFRSLHDKLFTGQTVGESRLKIEAFVVVAGQEIPKIDNYIKRELFFVRSWLEKVFPAYPKVIQTDLTPYLSFFREEVSVINPLPGQLPHEQIISESIVKLQALLENARQFISDYQEQLEAHYDGYSEAVSSSIHDYLEFTDHNLTQFGPAFLKNSAFVRFTTSLLGLFSKRQKEIKTNRLAVRTSIAHVRKVHLTRSYIEHRYNDETEVTNLQVYISNIHELYIKTETWTREYPANIAAWLKTANEKNIHPDLSAFKPAAALILAEYRELSARLHQTFNFFGEQHTDDIQSLINQLPLLMEKLIQLRQICLSIHTDFQKRTDHNIELKRLFGLLGATDMGQSIFKEPIASYGTLEEALEACGSVRQVVVAINEGMSEFRTFYDWQHFNIGLPPASRQLIDTVSRHLDTEWASGFECWYIFSLLTLFEPAGLPRDEFELQRFRQHKARFNEAQLNTIIARWSERQRQSTRLFKEKGLVINSLFNKKGSKGMRRNSLRAIVNREFELFTDFFPVLLLNPSVCSSILPLQEGLFDIVIFDEASQLRLEDTYPALIRGKAKIVSGDKHQMAPSSYFESGGALLDPIDEDEDFEEEDGEKGGSLNSSHRNLADSESLLAYAEDNGFRQRYLDIHYRSRHPYLIDFSNYAFYGSRLIPVPAKLNYKPIQYIQVDGIYEGQVNKEEALKVVELLKNHIKPFANGSYPTVGVATFNIYQRNLIWEEIDRQRQTDPVFDSLMSGLGGSFFVKNLENIQGDERDVIILSTTFGRKNNGSFSQNFGPIIQGKGHRMLNVIITRAKYKIFVCSSFPVEYISQYPDLLRKNRNRGRAVLYAYLMYAKAVSDGNEELRSSILHELSQHCSEKNYEISETGPGSASPFEDEVYERLTRHLGRDLVIRNYRIGGFPIDLVICSRHTGKPFIAIECDGAKYHSSPEAYAWDMFRQEQLERYGFKFYRIWSTKWWDAADKETERLLQFFSEQDTTSVIQPVSS